MLSINPELTADEVRNILQSTSDDIYDEGWDEETGYGRLNAYDAVNTAFNFFENNWILGDLNNDSLLNVLDLVVLVNLIIGIETNTEYCLLWSADFNVDDDINILDIIQIISVIIAN